MLYANLELLEKSLGCGVGVGGVGSGAGARERKQVERGCRVGGLGGTELRSSDGWALGPLARSRVLHPLGKARDPRLGASLGVRSRQEGD